MKTTPLARASAFDGSKGSQTAPVSAAKEPSSNQSTDKPPKPPAYPALLLNERQAAALMGVSTNKFHRLRSEEWFPPAIELGPRALRWDRRQLEDALTAQAPRRRFMPEPLHLVEARAATK